MAAIPIECVPMMIGDEPRVFWGKLKRLNRAFLAAIDVGYWHYQASTHGDRLQGDDADVQRAASAFRIAYGQGVETLLALLGACAQAPHLPLGWMSKYTNTQLRSVVKRIHATEPIYSPWGERISWDILSAVVHGPIPEPIRAEKQLVERFAGVWRTIAGEFLDVDFEPEYNALKHGMRAHTGPWSIALGPTSGGSTADPQLPRLVGRTEFGSSFRYCTKLPGLERSFEFQETSCAWSPPQFVLGLQLIGCSVQNVVARLGVQSGEDPTKLKFAWPAEEQMFDLSGCDPDGPWIRHCRLEQHIDPKNLREPTVEEIKRSYSKAARAYQRGHTFGRTQPGSTG